MATDNTQFWQAVERRDRGFDGRFFFGVVTTGVYCRPSCPSRRPLQRNVRFFDSPQQAERAGLRPCLRCRPLANAEPGLVKALEICRFIDKNPAAELDLAALAAQAGLSRFHLQRTFKATVGVTPKEYVEARRMQALKRGLRHAKDVTEAVYGAGFGSSSRVYERGDSRLGMTPQQYRRGATGLTVSYATAGSPFGMLMLGATDRGICFVQFGESQEQLLAALRSEFPGAELRAMQGRSDREFGQWMEGVRALMAGHAPHGKLPLDVRATAFQASVWNYLQTIPAGQTQSYAEVAAGLGKPSAARAVARACAANNVAVLIPCHRVIRGTGELGGYKWGMERKQALLAQEGSQ